MWGRVKHTVSHILETGKDLGVCNEVAVMVYRGELVSCLPFLTFTRTALR